MQIEPQPSVEANVAIAGTAPIAVVIPAYNAGAYLAATLQSVIAQTLRPREIIVVDDGSSDDTIAIANELGATVISGGHRGAAAARNAGTWAATSDYIAYLDADDIWPEQKLAVQFAALAAFSQPAFSFTDYQLFDHNGVHGSPSGLRRHPAFRRAAGNVSDGSTVVVAADGRRPVLSDMYFLPSSVLVRRADVLAIGGYDETLRTCEDYEFFLRLFRIVPALAVMQPLLLYRRHPTQMSASTIKMTLGLFDVEERVVAARDRYPQTDAAYIENKGYLLHYRIGISYARLGEFDRAIVSLKQSLAARPTIRARAALLASRACCAAPGRILFKAARALRRAIARQRHATSGN